MKIKCLVFDCDGVLLDSVPVKTQAFAHLAKPYGIDAVNKIVAYHDANGGLSRVAKFKWFFNTVLGREINDEEMSYWKEEFAKFVRETVLTCPMILGAQKVLDMCYKKIPMYVCSGTPQLELVDILENRGLAKFFEGIYGTPPEKKISLNQIVKDLGLNSQEILMVGDAVTDYDAAQYAKTKFYGIGEKLRDKDCPCSEDLVFLVDYILKNS